MNLCIECKYYSEQRDEAKDLCTHQKARMGGVRTIKLYTCEAMRAGICDREARLFVAKAPQEATA